MTLMKKKSPNESFTFPSILFDLDLDGFEFKAYCYFKFLQDNSDLNFIEIPKEKICKDIGCGKDKLLRIKINLEKKRSKLGGRSLISVTSNGLFKTDTISVNNIVNFRE